MRFERCALNLSKKFNLDYDDVLQQAHFFSLTVSAPIQSLHNWAEIQSKYNAQYVKLNFDKEDILEEYTFNREALIKILNQKYDKFNNREVKILKLFLKYNNFTKIASELNITRSRIGQIFEKIISKIKDNKFDEQEEKFKKKEVTRKLIEEEIFEREKCIKERKLEKEREIEKQKLIKQKIKIKKKEIEEIKKKKRIYAKDVSALMSRNKNYKHHYIHTFICVACEKEFKIFTTVKYIHTIIHQRHVVSTLFCKKCVSLRKMIRIYENDVKRLKTQEIYNYQNKGFIFEYL